LCWRPPQYLEFESAIEADGMNKGEHLLESPYRRDQIDEEIVRVQEESDPVLMLIQSFKSSSLSTNPVMAKSLRSPALMK
jgi:hypothetical protein